MRRRGGWWWPFAGRRALGWRFAVDLAGGQQAHDLGKRDLDGTGVLKNGKRELEVRLSRARSALRARSCSCWRLWL